MIKEKKVAASLSSLENHHLHQASATTFFNSNPVCIYHHRDPQHTMPSNPTNQEINHRDINEKLHSQRFHQSNSQNGNLLRLRQSPLCPRPSHHHQLSLEVFATSSGPCWSLRCHLYFPDPFYSTSSQCAISALHVAFSIVAT